jgi:D-lactate dehydrogenase
MRKKYAFTTFVVMCMKMVFYEVEKWQEEHLHKNLEDHKLHLFEYCLSSPDVVIEEVRDAEILSTMGRGHHPNKAALDLFPNLKFIALRCTGFDHVDLEECKRRNIIVSNVPYYGDNTVAEQGFCLLLVLLRKFPQYNSRVSVDDFSVGPIGFDLKGKTLGVIGAGRIGLHAIKIGRGFGMDVIAYDIIFNDFAREMLGYKYVSLDELLKKSDVISVHAPYNKYTHHMIDKTNIKLIKPGAILVNTARGAIVELEALKQALDEGILSGAALDVIEGEELLLKDRASLSQEEKEILEQVLSIIKRDNVVFTPHIAYYTREAAERILDTSIANIKAFLEGHPQNVVSKT